MDSEVLICIIAHRLISKRQKSKKKTTKEVKEVVMVLMMVYGNLILFFLHTNWSSTHTITAKTGRRITSTVIVTLKLPDIKIFEYPAIPKIGSKVSSLSAVSVFVNWSLKVDRIVRKKKTTSWGIIDEISTMCAISYSDTSMIQIERSDSCKIKAKSNMMTTIVTIRPLVKFAKLAIPSNY